MRLIDADFLVSEIKRHNDMTDRGMTWATWQVIELLENYPSPPNDPLTLEELREMDGEPVWITPGGFWALVIANSGERVRLICNDGERVFADREIELVGPVYRRKPEEGTI